MLCSCRPGIFGLVIGDALGVPVEFTSRKEIAKNPVREMRGGGIAQKPAGTWSDDSALTLATLDSLISGVNPDNCMKNFDAWLKSGKYTPDGDVFDVSTSLIFV